MRNILLIILTSLLLIGCGARKKIVEKHKEDVKTETVVKKDSIVKESVKTDSVSTVKIDDEQFEIDIEPTVVDTTKGQNTIIVETPSGKKTAVYYPKNSKINIKSGNKKQESKTDLKKDINKDIIVKSDSISKSDSKIIDLTKDLKKEEPKSFNITLASGIIGIILLILGLAYLRFKK